MPKQAGYRERTSVLSPPHPLRSDIRGGQRSSFWLALRLKAPNILRRIGAWTTLDVLGDERKVALRRADRGAAGRGAEQSIGILCQLGIDHRDAFRRLDPQFRPEEQVPDPLPIHGLIQHARERLVFAQ